MSNRNRMIKNNKYTKRAGFLAAAVLTAALITGQVPVSMTSVNAAQGQETLADVIPDNITISEPTELENITLPGNEYGILEWADGSYVPTKRVESCQVLLTPAEGQDLSQLEGWDEESGQVVGYINVVVADFGDDLADTDEEDPDEDTAEDTTENTDTANKEETDSAEDVQVTVTPEETEDKGESEEPSENGEETPDAEDASAAEQTPAVSEAPADTSEEVPSEDPSVTPVLSVTETPSESEDEDQQKDPELTETPEPSDNIFDNPIQPEQKDDRPEDADDSISETEKEERADINHTCNGITVSGIKLPWYVQFRVSSGDNYQFTNEDDAMIFQSYEFELWDLQNNTEYEIPSGEYISVTVPVKEGYQYTIEHLLDNGATETIIPSVEGDMMVFSTHSFSPFGIAGSKQLVGPNSGSDSQAATPTAAPVTVTPVSDTGNSSTASGNEQNTGLDSSDNSAAADASDASSDDSQAEDSNASRQNSVETGDTTNIVPFVVLIAAAVVVIGAVVFLKKKKK